MYDLLTLMKIEEFFGLSSTAYPIQYRRDYGEAVKKRLDEFVSSLSELSDPDFPIDRSHVTELCNQVAKAIVLSIRRYSDGFPVVAYSELSRCLDQIKSQLLSDVMRTKFPVSDLGYYRIRSFKEARCLSCDDLFHVPFEKRTKIGNYRFSITGHPCLYVGCSSLVCWYECDRPSQEETVIARYETWDAYDPTILFLAYHPQRTPQSLRSFLSKSPLWKDNPQNGANALFTILITYPLILASYFIVQNPEDPFKPEYVIPQLLLQWVRSNSDIGGVCFVSTKVDFDSLPLPLSLNYAFPVQTDQRTYKDFRNRFSSSLPFLATDANIEKNYKKIVRDEQFYDHHGSPILQHHTAEIYEPLEKIRADYWKTRWGRLDHLLQSTVHIPMANRKASAEVHINLDKLEKKQTKSWV